MKFRLLNTTYQNISSIRPPANLEFYLTLLHKCNKFDPKNQDICLSPIQTNNKRWVAVFNLSPLPIDINIPLKIERVQIIRDDPQT